MAAERSERATARARAKFEARREELAAAATQTLAEQGYAHTSLRDIAENADFSHGVFHYYFEDKLDLILTCARQYRAVRVNRYEEALTTARSPEQLRRGFAKLYAATLVDDALMHRLWYDLRAQALFEPRLQPVVREIDAQFEDSVWRIVATYAALAGARPRSSRRSTYALVDGLFRRALSDHLAGEAKAAAALRAELRDALDDLVGPRGEARETGADSGAGTAKVKKSAPLTVPATVRGDV